MDCHSAGGTLVEVTPRDLPARQRQGVTALFVVESKIRASLLPFAPMGGNAASPGAMMREQMREFVFQGLLNLGKTELLESRVKLDQHLCRIGQTGGALHAAVPADPYLSSKGFTTE
jgi:hypothetical protein